MLTQNRIYLPSEEEIVTTLGRAACRAPSLRSRLNRAGDLLRDHALRFERGEWFCDSAAADSDSSEPHNVYRVDFGACECPDCRTRRAVVGGAAYCKHLLALLAYRSICLDHLRSHLLGDLADTLVSHEARHAANAALLFSEGIDHVHPAIFAWVDAAHLRPRWVCSLVRMEHDLAFASPGHLGAFAAWLRQAQPLPPELEALMLYRRLRALGFDEENAAGAADTALAPLRMAA